MSDGRVLVFDIEANGLEMNDESTIHCICVQDYETGETWTFRNNGDENTLEEGWSLLSQARKLVAHNGVMYDIPYLCHVLGRNRHDLPGCLDTLLLSRLLYPDRYTHPAGGSSLAAWGWYLEEFKDKSPEDWSRWTPEMEAYCQQDVVVTVSVLRELLPMGRRFKRAVDLEHSVAQIIHEQIQNGFTLDMEAAQRLSQELGVEKQRVTKALQQEFPPLEEEMKTPQYWYVDIGEDEPLLEFLTKTEAKKAGFKDNEIQRGPNKIKVTPFNPGSRQQFAQRMKEKHGWESPAQTETGKPKIDEKILKQVNHEEARLMMKYLLVDKRISQLAQWLEYEQDGVVHGSVNTNGCVSGRMSHSNPNMAQVPASYSPFGKECRACWVPRNGFVLVGADASGLELRMLAHYLAQWDNGEYREALLDGDIHTFNQKAAGLSTRDQAKTFIYAWLYGAGDGKIGDIVGGSARKGKQLKDKFMSTLPAVKRLKRAVENKVKRDGELSGLDGRPLPVRSPHMALNTLLQSGGAVVMKQALVILHDALQGTSARFCANVHDEWQIECLPEEAERVGQAAVSAIRAAGKALNLRCPLDGEYKVGSNWSETH